MKRTNLAYFLRGNCPRCKIWRKVIIFGQYTLIFQSCFGEHFSPQNSIKGLFMESVDDLQNQMNLTPELEKPWLNLSLV